MTITDDHPGLAATRKHAHLTAVAPSTYDEGDPWPIEPPADDELQDDKPERKPARRIELTRADAIKPKPVIWAWEEDAGEGRIPAGSMSIAAGREGTGKSSFGLWMAAQITRGTLRGSFYGTPRHVFYVAVEDSWQHTIVPRLMAAGADLSMVYRCDVKSDEDAELMLSLPSDNSMLETAISDYHAALVVIDPLLSVIGERIDTHRSRDVRTALDPLAKMCDRTGAVLLGIAHFSKASGTDISSLITGSGAFKDVPRSVFGFARDDESEDGSSVMTQSKNSLGRYDLPSLAYRIVSFELDTDDGIANTGRFEFTGQSERSVSDLLREANSTGSADRADERREIDEWLRARLQHEGCAADAAECLRDGKLAGFSEDALKKARKRIGATTKRSGFGKGSTVTWSIDAS